MDKVILAASLLVSAQAMAGRGPTDIPVASELGLVGMSLILVGFAARLIAKKAKKA